MIIKSFRSSAAALCVSAFTLMTTSTSQGGSLVFKNIFGMESASSVASVSSSRSSSATMTRAGRGGLDDPANHDANDDRRSRQPGDDHGRHRGHGR